MNVARRNEDRRSCHNVSLVLGLALAARKYDAAAMLFQHMLNLVTQVSGQKSN